MLPAQYDLLIAGEINPDLILSDPNLEPRFGQVEILVENFTLAIGSSSAILSCGAARLGLKVAFIGVVGKDLFGDYMLGAMSERGVDVSPVIIDPDQRTGITLILSRGADRAILTYLGAMDALRSDQISQELLLKARHLHVSSYFLQTALQVGLSDLFRQAHDLGLTTSLDLNWDPSEKWAGVEHLMSLIDILMLNENEARSIAKTSGLDEAVTRLGKKVPILAVKMGAQGAIARRGHELVRLPAVPVDVVDTVGAGDSFDAGILYGYLRGWNFKETLQLGVACGSLSTTAHGGTEAQPTLRQARQAIQRYLKVDDER